MVGLTTQRINLTSHFLCDEPQLLTLPVTTFQSTDEILQMIGKALLLLIDIQFLNVINKFLLQAVLIIIHTQGLFQGIGDTFFDFNNTFFLVRRYRFEQMSYIGYFLTEFLFQSSPFLFAEVHQMVDSFTDGSMYNRPLFVTQLLRFVLRHHIR